MNDLNKALYEKIRNGDNFEVLKVLSFNVYFKAMQGYYMENKTKKNFEPDLNSI